ncbi:MAG: hypothetical protein RL653_3880 [Pseudomonadota bacterium]|jgi:hypothetical protein
MPVPLLGMLLATAPAPAPAADALASLFDGWSMGYTASLGVAAGREGVHPVASAGLASTVFDGPSVESHLAAALSAWIAPGPELELRLAVGGRPVAWGPCSLGVISSGALRWTDGIHGTLRAGPELSAHFRLGATRHVLQPFLRYEWALLDRARFEDRATAGLQFLLAD